MLIASDVGASQPICRIQLEVEGEFPTPQSSKARGTLHSIPRDASKIELWERILGPLTTVVRISKAVTIVSAWGLWYLHRTQPGVVKSVKCYRGGWKIDLISSISEIDTNVVPLHSVHQAPSYVPNLTLLAWFLRDLAFLSNILVGKTKRKLMVDSEHPENE